MFTKRRTCPASSRKCLLIAGKRCSISPSKSGSVSELHSIVCTPSVNRRSAVGISTVIFIIFLFLSFVSTAAEKYRCHSEPSEESLCGLDSNRREILRFAQNDTRINFSAASCALVPSNCHHAIVDERFKHREARLDRGRKRVLL